MSFDWSKYLDLAQELTNPVSSSSNQEAKLRCAVSRAYYAAFCKARNHLRDIDGLSVPHDGSAHVYVKNQYKNHPVKRRKKIGVSLERMKINRGKADYDDVVNNLSEVADINLKLASKVITVLRTL